MAGKVRPQTSPCETGLPRRRGMIRCMMLCRLLLRPSWLMHAHDAGSCCAVLCPSLQKLKSIFIKLVSSAQTGFFYLARKNPTRTPRSVRGAHGEGCSAGMAAGKLDDLPLAPGPCCPSALRCGDIVLSAWLFVRSSHSALCCACLATCLRLSWVCAQQTGFPQVRPRGQEACAVRGVEDEMNEGWPAACAFQFLLCTHFAPYFSK